MSATEKRHYRDASTATTQETISLADRIRVIEHKLDYLLEKPSYASVIQQHVPPIPSQPVVQSPPTPVEDTRFIVEVENLVPKDFIPPILREKLHNLLPPPVYSNWWFARGQPHMLYTWQTNKHN